MLCASQKRDRVAVLVRRDAESEAEQTRRVAHAGAGREVAQAGPLVCASFATGCTQLAYLRMELARNQETRVIIPNFSGTVATEAALAHLRPEGVPGVGS